MPIDIFDSNNAPLFKKELDATSGTAIETAIGVCEINGKKVKCVQKTYKDDEDSFNDVIFAIRNHLDIIEKFGPKVIHVNEDRNVVTIEFIKGETLENIITKSINPWDKKGLQDFKKLVKNSQKAIEKLNKAGFCHNDVNLGNFLVTNNSNIRMIDFDNVRKKKKCSDSISFIEHLRDGLDDNVVIRRREANIKFDAQERSIEELLESL